MKTSVLPDLHPDEPQPQAHVRPTPESQVLSQGKPVQPAQDLDGEGVGSDPRPASTVFSPLRAGLSPPDHTARAKSWPLGLREGPAEPRESSGLYNHPSRGASG